MTWGVDVDLASGSIVGGYEVLRPLGAGGMGTVYLARHPHLPREVALKVLHPGLAATPGQRARFEREADVLCRLSHPNIVDVLDRGQDGVHLWMTMQYVRGSDAAALLEHEGALPPTRALAIVDAVALALDHAHECGLLHRDVKPANILLAGQPGGGERIWLTDFGIAKAIAADPERMPALTRTGQVVASFAYAPPEQVLGQVLDARADVYSLGAVLFELLTGHRAFSATDALALMATVVHTPAPDVRSIRPDLPPEIGRVLARALAKDPAERFSSCRELVRAARAAWPEPQRAPVTVQTRPDIVPPPREPTGRAPEHRSSRSGRMIGIAVAAAAVAVAVAVVVVVAPWDDGGTGSPASTSTSTSPGPGDQDAAAQSAGSGEAVGSWGDLQFIVDDFPQLLPSTVEGTGWDGLTCTPAIYDIDLHADVGLQCSHPNGITVEVTHYPDLAARDARRLEVDGFDGPDSPETWFRDETRAGVRYTSGPDYDTYVWQWITFSAQDKALYVVILEWAGHTHDELDRTWFSQAPFAGPAGR